MLELNFFIYFFEGCVTKSNHMKIPGFYLLFCTGSLICWKECVFNWYYEIEAIDPSPPMMFK